MISISLFLSLWLHIWYIHTYRQSHISHTYVSVCTQKPTWCNYSLQFVELCFEFLLVDWFYFYYFHVRYYEGLQKCVGLYSENSHFSPDEIDRLDDLYKSLGQQYQASSAVKVAHFVYLCLLHLPFLRMEMLCFQ